LNNVDVWLLLELTAPSVGGVTVVVVIWLFGLRFACKGKYDSCATLIQIAPCRQLKKTSDLKDD
jgi:hypothetical protein